MPAAPRTGKVQRRPVHGVLLLHKPIGLSSNQALQRAKWLLQAEKAGHTGTLDPLASGVLPLCFGAATKFSQRQLDAVKTYSAQLQLGIRTSTGDAEGEVLERRAPVLPDAPVLEQLAQRFSGRISQIPPMHSALKVAGKALYHYARAGQTLERAPREVFIHRLCLSPGPVEASLSMSATVSKGTYIRTLAEDLGAALGCGAHLTQLRRDASTPFTLDQCLSLEQFEALDTRARLRALLPAEALLQDCATVSLDAQQAGRFLTGARLSGAWPSAPAIAVYGHEPRALLGLAHSAGAELIAQRLLSPIEIQQILEQNLS